MGGSGFQGVFDEAFFFGGGHAVFPTVAVPFSRLVSLISDAYTRLTMPPVMRTFLNQVLFLYWHNEQLRQTFPSSSTTVVGSGYEPRRTPTRRNAVPPALCMALVRCTCTLKVARV